MYVIICKAHWYDYSYEMRYTVCPNKKETRFISGISSLQRKI